MQDAALTGRVGLRQARAVANVLADLPATLTDQQRDHAESLLLDHATRTPSKQLAGSLSGGEQQMVTIGRALMSRPSFIMLDEPSQGLAPKLVGEVFDTILKMNEDMDLTILLVEQNAEASLNAANYVYIMHEGIIKAEGKPEEIKGSPEIREAYLGI